MYHPSMKAKMDTLEAERARLEAALLASPEPEPVALHPGLAGIYARKVSDLAEALDEEGTRAEAADLLRGLIEKVVLHPDPDAPHGHRIEPFGELAAILSLCSGGLATHAKARTGGAGLRQVTVVAGAGFEPAAFRL
jgi:site-specific DNA recombinase